jgi:hypothetical protein
VFDDFVTGEQNKHVLRHAEYDAQVVNNGQNREDRPSDHRPVSVELEY